MERLFTLDKAGSLCIWKWSDDYLSEGYLNLRRYQQQKTGKKIKLEQYKEEEIDEENQDENQKKDGK